MRACKIYFLFFIITVTSFFSSYIYSEDDGSEHGQNSETSVSSQQPLVFLLLALDKNLSKSPMKHEAPSPESKMPGMNTENAEPMEKTGQPVQKSNPPQGMSESAVSPELPGFPGASHIYHIGAKDFFLDLYKKISLTFEQQTKLKQIKELALFNQATSLRKIEQAEQELWQLTSSDKPDITYIEKKTKEIESLRSERRISFIRSVGEAAKVITPMQRSHALKKKDL